MTFLGGFNLAFTQSVPTGFKLEKIISGLNPVAMTIDPFERIWVAEKHGEVLIFENGKALKDPFITLDVDAFNERGLLGIALHPDYVSNGYVYIYYTVPNEARNRVIRVKSNGDHAIPGSEEVIIELDKLSGDIHNGGAMVFDSTGHLFIGTGDGSNGPAAQSLASTLGKILRLEEDGKIPADNPFVNQTSGIYQAIYAIGLRNPFSIVYDDKINKIWVSDVGQGLAEEVNIIDKGGNYGWPYFEGSGSGDGLANYHNPYFYYGHDKGCAIVGAALTKNNPILPESIQDVFLFADYCSGELRYFKENETGNQYKVWMKSEERPLAIHVTQKGKILMLTRSGIGGGSTADNTSTFDGAVWEISYSGNGAPYFASQPEDIKIAKKESANIGVTAFGEGELVYSWILDTTVINRGTSSTIELTNLLPQPNDYLLTCIVSNHLGMDTTAPIRIKVIDGTRPQPLIILPYDDYKYQAGDMLSLVGRAVDEGKLMHPRALDWKIDLHHGTHSHPLVESMCCTTNPEIFIPSIGETDTNVWIRISLFATDSSGLSGNHVLDLYPDISLIRIEGKEGLKVNIDGSIYTLPTNVYGTKGLLRRLFVQNDQIIGDSVIRFSSWDGNLTSQSRELNMPDSLITLHVFHRAHILGTGTGLRGEYFEDDEFIFRGDPVLIRTDSLIQFDWGQGSPDKNISRDFFIVRWTGYIQPIFDEDYTFYLFTDDGSRLYIDEELIIDEWHNQPPTELVATKKMQAGKKYRIRIEYLESKGGSIIEFKWSSASTRKQIVPKRQLYEPVPFAQITGIVFIDSNKNHFPDVDDDLFPDGEITLIDSRGESLQTVKTDSFGVFRFINLDAGTHQIQFNLSDFETGTYFIDGFDQDGLSPTFDLRPGSEMLISIPLHRLLSDTDKSNFKDATVYPNPFSETLHFDIQEEIISVEIYDMQGKMQWSQIGNTNYIEPQISPGICLLKINTKAKAYNFKILKI